MKIPVDKQLHFLAGVALAGVLYISTHDLVVTFFLTSLVGIFKEVMDKLGYGTYEWSDLIYTSLGFLPVLCATIVGNYYAT